MEGELTLEVRARQASSLPGAGASEQGCSWSGRPSEIFSSLLPRWRWCAMEEGLPASPWFFLVQQVRPQGETQDRLRKEQSLSRALVLEAGGTTAMQGCVGKPRVVGRQEMGESCAQPRPLLGFPGERKDRAG